MPTFRKKKCTDAMISDPSRLARWKSLSLYEGLITVDGFRNLLHAEKLKELELVNCGLTDEGLEVISHHSGITSLLCHQIRDVTDAGMRHLSKMTQLRELYLNDAAITDSGMESLRSLQNVWSLSLNGTAITDAGIAALNSLESLKLLNVEHTRISGVGFRSFDSTSIGSLYLSGSPLTSSGIEMICNHLASLRRLSVDDTLITDEDAMTISTLQHLSTVNLSNTRIKDEGIRHFLGHPRLEVMYVRGLDIAEKTIQSFQRSGKRRVTVYS